MDLNSQQQHILAAIDAAAPTIHSVSRQIHDRPELGYQEVFACGLMQDTLRQFGFEIETGFAGMPTAFCARKGDPNGPRVAFLAEYDALPDLGHGCGHNIIATSALSAGIGLGAVIDQLHGQVWVIGTPAEETDGGKVVMVQRNAFDAVDAAMMIHPHEGNYMITEALAMDAIQVEFFGKPSHAAAAPWEGINALDAVILLFTSLNALRQQLRPDARIHGIITRGGMAPNIIPDYTAARFYLRARQRSYVNEMVGKFKNCVAAAAQSTGTRFELSNYENGFDDMVNNLTLAQRMTGYMTGALGSGPFKRSPDAFGSIDMGNVSHVVPGIHILVDIADGKTIYPHTPEFCNAAASDYAAQTILRAGKGLALTGYDVIHDPAFLQQVKDEFKQSQHSLKGAG